MMFEFTINGKKYCMTDDKIERRAYAKKYALMQYLPEDKVWIFRMEVDNIEEAKAHAKNYFGLS